MRRVSRVTARATGVKINAAQGSLGDVPLPTVVPSSALGTGLFARYWSNGEQSGTPTRTQVDPTVDVGDAPPDLGPVWSARWTGTLTPPETGLYRLSLLEAGIAKVSIDGRQYRLSTEDLEAGSLLERVRAHPGMEGADLAAGVSTPAPYAVSRTLAALSASALRTLAMSIGGTSGCVNASIGVDGPLFQ